MRVIFEGLTLEQAKEFAHWFEGQGEQDFYEWASMHGIESPNVDVGHKGGWLKVDKVKGDVTVQCHTP